MAADDVISSSGEGITQANRLHLLNEIGRVVSSTLDLHALYETIYEQIGRVMDTTQFYISLYQPHTNSCFLPFHREDDMEFRDQVMPFGSNVTSLVIRDGTPLLFNTHTEYGNYAAAHGLPELTVGQHDSEAKIWVPLSTGDRTIGALSVQSTRQHAYTLDDLQMLSVIASQAAVAIVNAGLYAQSQENVRQMQALLHVAQTVNGSLELEACLDAILAGIREVMPYYIAAILMPNPHQNYLDIVGTVGPLPEERKKLVKVPVGHGVTGTAFSTGEAICVSNVREFPGYIPGDGGVASELAVPLKRGDQVVGVLDVESEEIDAFTQDDVNLLTLFASQAAIAIENARLFAEEQRRIHELSTIQSIVQKLTPLHDIPSIARVIENELRALINYNACRLFFLDAEHQILLPVSYSGWTATDYRLRVGEGLAGWVAEHGQTAIVTNTLTDPRVIHLPGTPRREESMIGAPLIYEGRVQGILTLTAPGIDQFDKDDLRLLQIITGQAAIVFDRARLYAELRRDAITDPLTGLYNRRHLDRRLQEELVRSARTGAGLSAILLDIDEFKRVNDRFGHDAGDRVLQDLAPAITSTVRPQDIVARYGGEEFCVLIPGAERQEAEWMAERLWRHIAERELPDGCGARHITVSVGVAHLEPADDEERLLNRADMAMYAGKRGGGNMVHVDEGGVTRTLWERPVGAPAGPTME